jgi:outer membrane protein OmpA-like peptidoglycan-associated protein
VLLAPFPALLVCLGLGCAHPGQTAVAKLPPPNSNGDYSPDWPDLGQGEARYITFELGDSFETCRHLSPKFPFDSAHTRAEDRAQLRAFASCMNDPVMAGRKILLVGRTDDRGAKAYNQDLGMKRAERIKALLLDNGVNADRIEVKSAGESGAEGESPDSSYGYDRRVDVIVEGGVHAPGPPKAS